MIYTDMTKKAIKLIYEKHKDKYDKAGMPYVLHPLHVAENQTDEYRTTVALLHDIVEDTDVTFEQLIAMGYPNEVVDALRLLTHKEGTEYFEYVKEIGTNEIATDVKLADLEHNCDLSRLNEITEWDLIRAEKYKKCIEYLNNIKKLRTEAKIKYRSKKESIMDIKNLNKFKKDSQKGDELEKLNSQVIDGIFGFAIADSVGVPAEFESRLTLKLKPITDMIGYGTHGMPAGTWSDDTSMTIATMDSINNEKNINYDDMMNRFTEWKDNSKYTATGVFFDIGISTSSALNNYKRGIPATECGGKGIRDNGNGSLMRILPIVLYLHSIQASPEEQTRIINESSSLTHGHEISRLGCKIYCDYIMSLLDGKSLNEALDNLKYLDYSQVYSKESLKYYQRILDGSIINEPEENIKSSGFVVDTLEASIWCAHNSSSYEESVLKAVNLGGDTDTVAAVTGSITGLQYGYEQIPFKWRENLKSKEYLMELCKKNQQVLNEYKIKKMNL